MTERSFGDQLVLVDLIPVGVWMIRRVDQNIAADSRDSTSFPSWTLRSSMIAFFRHRFRLPYLKISEIGFCSKYS